MQVMTRVAAARRGERITAVRLDGLEHAQRDPDHDDRERTAEQDRSEEESDEVGQRLNRMRVLGGETTHIPEAVMLRVYVAEQLPR